MVEEVKNSQDFTKRDPEGKVCSSYVSAEVILSPKRASKGGFVALLG